ncbi:hypothetical protein [Lichenibacterium dinghuense]|nr:hypothetical protein [Lichenibacterium sp. 6Y81]
MQFQCEHHPAAAQGGHFHHFFLPARLATLDMSCLAEETALPPKKGEE